MPHSDPRFTPHNITVQRLDTSYELPRKRLSHTSKTVPSDASSGSLTPIRKRARVSVGFGVFAGLRGRG